MTRIAHRSTSDNVIVPKPVLSPDRARLLELLGSGESDPLTITELRDRGVHNPGQAIYELELDGYPVERVRHRRPAQSCRMIGYRIAVPGAQKGRDASDAAAVE